MESHKFNADDLAVAARRDGFLGLKLYAVFTSPTTEKEAGKAAMDAVMDQHLTYQKHLEASGVLFAAGPLGTETEELIQGDGLIVVRAASLKEATAIADADPMHKSGARTFRIRPWIINEGSLSVQMSFSSGSFTVREE